MINELDSELTYFASDYRKLTFFYYAEEYINFNELVTDLFKVYKTRIWMSAINPSTYMAMNPNTAPRPPHVQRPVGAPHAGHAAAYLRTQEDYRTALEHGGKPSPVVDRDGPAARGNREFERVMQMQGQSRVGARPSNEASPATPGGLSEGELKLEGRTLHVLIRVDFPAGMQPFYDPRRPNPAFGSGQFPAFGQQYGPTVPANGAWPQNGTPGAYPFMYPSSRENMNPNYSVSPLAGMAPNAMNQQAAAFTPRGTLPQQQQYPANGSTYDDASIHKLLNDQFQRFQIETSRRS
jgi:hypothetical protein